MNNKIEIGEYGRTNKGKIFIFAWLQKLDGKRYTNFEANCYKVGGEDEKNYNFRN